MGHKIVVGAGAMRAESKTPLGDGASARTATSNKRLII